MQLTKNFSVEEFRCPCGQCDGGAMDRGFIDLLQKLREKMETPLIISSGFRCPAHNEKVGGVGGSYHLLGRAADILTPRSSFQTELVECARQFKFGGLGIAREFVHLDNREKISTWVYNY